MEKWSGKGRLCMLVNQGKFERDIDDCSSKISDCFTIFTVSTLRLDRETMLIFQTVSQMELLAQRQEEVERRTKESHDGRCHRKTSPLREFDAVKFLSAGQVVQVTNIMHSLWALFFFFSNRAAGFHSITHRDDQ